MQITFKGKPVHIFGNLPSLHTKAPDFHLVDKNLADRTLREFDGKRKLIGTVPSLDTGVCMKMTKRFNEFGQKHPHLMIIAVSADLPFAQKRFCDAEKVENVLTLSMMRDKGFGQTYGILIQDGPLAGILARSVLVLDEKDRVLYTELVSELTGEPDYERAFEAISN